MNHQSLNQQARTSPLPLLIALFLTIFFLASAAPCVKAAEDPTEVLEKFGDAMVKVAEKAKPAVVNISTSKTVKTQRHPFFDDPFFKRFFGEGGMPQKRKVTNLGSGVIASADGYILTNNHVIEGAEDILVKLADNREFKGKVIGTDPRTDIAVIKIEASDLPTVPWADSDKLHVGQVVLAIGNPYGLNQTITMGIISALGRSGLGITDYEDFIQTDAAINPGNSGGALVNTKGELIGINTAIFSTSGGYQGIGLAIPSNMVRSVIDSIINQGKVVRGWLGVQIQQLTPELAKQFDLKDDHGVLLVDIVEGGPAEKSGLKRGDVLIEYDGKKVDTPVNLRNLVAATKPGTQVKVVVLREGKPVTIGVTIEELRSDQQAAAGVSLDNALRGVSVQDLTDQILQSLGITKKIKGVIITNIEEDSPSSGAITKGDIIVEINRKPVENLSEYNAAASKIEKDQGIVLLIVRNGIYQYVTIPATK
ncbi:MAG: DegQ family serine endoprotease [Chloroflexota bacterium]